VLRWVTLGGGGGSLPAPEPPKVLEAPALAPSQPAAPPTQPMQAETIGTPITIDTPVTEPSLSEEMGGDAVPF
jgi:hypothetical protein